MTIKQYYKKEKGHRAGQLVELEPDIFLSSKRKAPAVNPEEEEKKGG